MTEVASAVPIEALELQSNEIAQRGLRLDDADFAYRLQLQEALRISAADCDVECVSLSDQSQPDEQLSNNKLQASIGRSVQRCP